MSDENPEQELADFIKGQFHGVMPSPPKEMLQELQGKLQAADEAHQAGQFDRVEEILNSVSDDELTAIGTPGQKLEIMNAIGALGTATDGDDPEVVAEALVRLGDAAGEMWPMVLDLGAVAVQSSQKRPDQTMLDGIMHVLTADSVVHTRMLVEAGGDSVKLAELFGEYVQIHSLYGCVLHVDKWYAARGLVGPLTHIANQDEGDGDTA